MHRLPQRPVSLPFHSTPLRALIRESITDRASRPKKDKYPFGYPGDEFGPSAIPHHECVECKAIFPGGAPDGTPCAKCERPKDAACPRLKPRKVEPEPDPAILQSVQAKIESLKLG